MRCRRAWAGRERSIPICPSASRPDIVTSAKGLGGGLPIGAALFGERTADVLTPGTHGSTFGGNPVVCAGACNIVGRLTPEFLSEVARKGGKGKNRARGRGRDRMRDGQGDSCWA